jgi:hypothetical protein
MYYGVLYPDWEDSRVVKMGDDEGYPATTFLKDYVAAESSRQEKKTERPGFY